MLTSELITPAHLARKAVIYIRQSSPNQVLSHQESLQLQYALRERALGFGWQAADITVIDNDLGLSASSAHHREGFKEVLALVTLGQVGIIFSFDVTRLARNCSDWYPLLDLCGYQRCLIADRDGVYDPGSTNGRLLLGLKGQLSELELHTLRGRLTAGLLHKAERGALAQRLPAGLVRDLAGRVVKDPNQEVQDRITLVFDTFLQRRSASQVLTYLASHDLCLPRTDSHSRLFWKQPTYAAVISILKNPAYAGAFVYGRTRTTRSGPTLQAKTFTRVPQEQWRIRIQDIYPAYIDWATYERIQLLLRDNHADYTRQRTSGVPRPGAAVLQGIVSCGICGHKLAVQYKGRTQYICHRLRQQYRAPVCQAVPADAVDQAVVSAFFQALAPIELDAYQQAIEQQHQQQARLAQGWQQQLNRLRYEADLAQRQFTLVDPENRLVAATLERRWEDALRALQQAQAAARQETQAEVPVERLPAELQARFRALGQRLPELWQQDVLDTAHKKGLLRCLITQVVLQRVARDQIAVRIVWRGGATTSQTVPVTVGTVQALSNAAALEEAIVEQSKLGYNDAEIARQLTAQGYRSPHALVLLEATVKRLRVKNGQLRSLSQSHRRRVPGYLTVSQLAEELGISPYWIYHRLDTGVIAGTKNQALGLYLFPDTPATRAMFRSLPGFPHATPGSLEGHHHA